MKHLRSMLLGALLFGPIMLFTALARAGHTDYWFAKDTLLFNVPFVVAMVLSVRHARRSTDRAAWRWIAASMAMYTFGNIVYDYQDAHPGLPWWSADVPYLATLPCLYVAITLLVRARIDRWQPSLALDGLVAFTGICALLYEPLYANLISKDASLGRTIVYSAYPLFDLMLIAAAVAASLLLRHGMSRSWLLLTASFFTFALADTWYLQADLAGTYQTGHVGDASWMVAGALVGAASLAKWRNRGVTAITSGTMLMWPMVISGAVICSMAWSAMQSEAHVVTTLTGLACLALTVARTALTLRESRLMTGAHESRTDEVTGLGNRRRFDEQLTRAGEGGLAFSLAIIDLDGFKRVNDAFGHDTGDRLLRMVAERIERIVDETAQCSRIGGDEFALLLPIASAADAEAVMKRLHADLRKPYRLDGGRQNAQIDASIGIAVHSGGSLADLVRDADRAMYQSKNAGGGVSVDRGHDEDRERDISELEMIQAMREAMSDESEDDGLVVYYQPIMPTSSADRAGMEALARWKHRGEVVSPAVFIPLAEQNGMMQYVTRRMLEMSVADTAAERARTGRDLVVSVNLAVSSLMDPTLLPTIRAALRESKLPASALKLEITESMVITDPKAAQRTVNGLRDLGIDVMVDDYGTGYASIGHLQSLNVDGLKLDRSLIDTVASDQRMQAIVKATIEMGHALDIKVVAEGVETIEQRQMLTQLGCDFIQGFLIGRPMPLDQLGVWLDAQSQDGEPLAA
jgi:diguanylate cyclase (GGDEF)-like protein